jgi:hypothetical protein
MNTATITTDYSRTQDGRQLIAARISEFLAALNAKSEYGTFEGKTPAEVYVVRYVRVAQVTGGQRRAYAFIDITNGDILKPASWKSPAKHARGNIFAADLGLSCCGRYSVAYMNGVKVVA